jgi:hypothetical protein
MIASQPSDSGIEAITGEPISSVAFVHDYVEIHFDGKIVRSLSMPTVRLGDILHTFPAPGSRDALCSLIGQTVERVVATEDECIEIALVGGNRIFIPLEPGARVGPEAAHYVPGRDEPIIVW